MPGDEAPESGQLENGRDAFMMYVSALLDVVDPDDEFDPAVIEPLIGNLRAALLGQPVAAL